MFKSLLLRVGVDAVVRDATRLIQDMGDGAVAAAGDLAWKEDAGLLVARRPGHWSRVQAEIGQRTGKTLMEMDLRVASADLAAAQLLHRSNRMTSDCRSDNRMVGAKA